MNDKEWDSLLTEALGTDTTQAPYLDTHLRGALSAAREAGRGFSLWWLPLALAVAVCPPLLLLGALFPWPVSVILQTAAILTVVITAIFTGLGLAYFDLRERGRVFA